MKPHSGFFGTFASTQRGAKGAPGDALAPETGAGTAPFQGSTWAMHGDDAGWHGAADIGVAWNGEIHNQRDLCQQLELPTETPLQRLLLAAWRRWSCDCLPRLNGVFSLVVRSGSDLYLYRDPSGLRGLYYVPGSNGQVAFSSHLDTLLRLSSLSRRLSRRSLHEYLRFGDIAAPNTLYEGVSAVEAGQVLRWTLTGIKTCSWPEVEPDAIEPASFSDAVQALDGRLKRSVQALLEGGHRPAAFLSGGIDSSLICALASRQRPDTTAITVGFEPATHDEAPLAELISSHLGMRHEVLRFRQDEYVSAFARLSQHLEQPMADPATAATVLAFDHCRERYDVVLDGTGADEAVGAMPPRHVRLGVGYASLLPRPVRGGLVKLLLAAPGLSAYAPILDFEHPAEMMIRWQGFTRPEIEELCGEPASFAHTHFYQTFSRFPRHAHYERYSALLNAMPCERLAQATLLTGLRVRYPFCDPETDRFIRQLRTDWRYLPGEPKRILRAVLAAYVPRRIWDVPKHGFDFPLRQFLAADDFGLVRRHLDAGRWRETGLLRADVVQRYARQFIAGDPRMTFRVWALVVLGAWMEAHDELL